MGTLYIVSTPIGNLTDITLRALRILREVDVIACEDTRQTTKLLRLLKLPMKRLVRYDNATEHAETGELLDILEKGTSVALVSDAGTPLISDPGYVLVREARKHGVPVVSIPGPSAVLAALVSSGLQVDKFLFMGYPPEKQAHRLTVFASLPKDTTIIIYCAPHKLIKTLEDMRDSLGDIEAVICKELTKMHEAYWRGSISEALRHFSNPRGEFVVLFHI